MTRVDELSARSRSESITEWYVKVFPPLAAYIQRRGGSLEEAKETFQEAIVLYYEKLALSGFSPEKTNEAYLLGLAKKRWFRYCARNRGREGISHIDIAEEKEREPIPRKLLHYLEQSGKKCLDVLQAFYYENLTMEQLAGRFGFKSARSATVQKYKCLEKVREQVKRKAMCYEDFLS